MVGPLHGGIQAVKHGDHLRQPTALNCPWHWPRAALALGAWASNYRPWCVPSFALADRAESMCSRFR